MIFGASGAPEFFTDLQPAVSGDGPGRTGSHVAPRTGLPDTVATGGF